MLQNNFNVYRHLLQQTLSAAGICCHQVLHRCNIHQKLLRPSNSWSMTQSSISSAVLSKTRHSGNFVCDWYAFRFSATGPNALANAKLPNTPLRISMLRLSSNTISAKGIVHPARSSASVYHDPQVARYSSSQGIRFPTGLSSRPWSLQQQQLPPLSRPALKTTMSNPRRASHYSRPSTTVSPINQQMPTPLLPLTKTRCP